MSDSVPGRILPQVLVDKILELGEDWVNDADLVEWYKSLPIVLGPSAEDDARFHEKVRRMVNATT